MGGAEADAGERVDRPRVAGLSPVGGDIVAGLRAVSLFGSVRCWPLCYYAAMASKLTTADKRRRTTTVPVTTMEEIPVLSDQERADLAASLKDAEARVKAGEAIDYEPKSFKKRLLDIYRGVKR